MMDESFEDNFHQKKNVLALRLQQRRPREVLADQGIMPPLKSPGAFFPEIQRLERARNKDYLNHALPARPDRDVLVQRHILEDTTAASSIVANQKDLKKAKLVDDLNDKIALRPGVFELVERNILPANEDLQEAIKGGHIQYKKISDYIDDDSNEALSPEQTSNLTPSSSLFQISPATFTAITTSPSSANFTSKNDGALPRSSSGSTLFTQSSSHPYLSRQSSKGSKQSILAPKISSVRKKKEKPKFKKLKYHQYKPPDQLGKADDKNSMLSEDTPYSRLLHQQQVYLQMQIMKGSYGNNQRSVDSQPSASFNHQGAIPPAPPFSQSMKTPAQRSRGGSGPLTQNRLDEMKVSELKEELKQRHEKVTGTKEVLVERLKPYCVASDAALSEDGNSSFSMMSEAGSQMAGHTVLSPRVARMPAPERHTVVLKREMLTMPTWNHTGESMGTQTMFPPNQTVGGAEDKDKILEQQRMEIHALKQLVEKTQAQLHHHHFYTPEQLQVINPSQDPNQATSAAFHFPIVSHSASVQTNDPSMSVQQPQQQQINQPFDQSFDLMNEPPSSAHPSEASSMDDLLDLITDNTADVQPSPVARVLLNDHNSYHGLDEPNTYGQQTDFGGQPVRMRRSSRRRPMSANRLSREYIANGQDYTGQNPRGQDVAKMLVDSSGDALMDTTSFPPVMHRYSYPILDQHSNDHTRLNSRNSVDANLVYTNFSPMDTGSVGTGSQQDLLNDIRLSTSSLDSNEALLNAGMSPAATPPRRIPSHIVPLSGRQNSSPRFSNQLVKSASQELLSSNSPSHGSRPPNSELGWLDLTLGSAVGNPPSPGNPFETLSMSNQTSLPYQHSNPVSNRGSQDADLNLFSGDPSGILSYSSNPNSLDFPLDNYEEILSSHLHT